MIYGNREMVEAVTNNLVESLPSEEGKVGEFPPKGAYLACRPELLKVDGLKNTAQRLPPLARSERRVPTRGSTLSRLERLGQSPPAASLSAAAGSAWLEGEIDAWIEARAAERGQAAA